MTPEVYFSDRLGILRQHRNSVIAAIGSTKDQKRLAELSSNLNASLSRINECERAMDNLGIDYIKE